MTRVACLSTEDVELHWDVIKELLRPAVSKSDGEWEMQDVYEYIMQQQAFVVVGGENEFDLAMVCKPVHYPCKSVLTFLFVGGKGLVQFAIDHHQLFFELARDFHCKDIEVHGEGMARLLQQFGNGRLVRTIFRAEV